MENKRNDNPSVTFGDSSLCTREPKIPKAGFYCADCLTEMRKFPDGWFDFAIVDPPYGTPEGFAYRGRGGGAFRRAVRPVCERRIERTGGTWAAKYGKKIAAWDEAPSEEYFKELFRVSRHVIIWGGNYFDLPPCRCFLVWKKTNIPEKFTMAMCEYAWTNLNENAKVFEYASFGKGGRFHPTQKPVELYTWICRMFLKKGMKVLDTHVGSASSLIAYHRAGVRFWGYEIDPEYYEKAKKRLDEETAQISIDDLPEVAEQVGMFEEMKE